jgi:alkylhydroperoxidase family enzyme
VTTTWLGELAPGDTDWERCAASWPVPFDALGSAVIAAWDATDPVLLELCRVRMATLLDFAAEQTRRTERARTAGLAEETFAELPRWPASSRFGDRERACLAFAEQFVIDANGVTDELVAAVTTHLGPEGCYAFVQALSMVETFLRACLTLGIETRPDVDALVAAARSGAEDGRR